MIRKRKQNLTSISENQDNDEDNDSITAYTNHQSESQNARFQFSQHLQISISQNIQNQIIRQSFREFHYPQISSSQTSNIVSNHQSSYESVNQGS